MIFKMPKIRGYAMAARELFVVVVRLARPHDLNIGPAGSTCGKDSDAHLVGFPHVAEDDGADVGNIGPTADIGRAGCLSPPLQ